MQNKIAAMVHLHTAKHADLKEHHRFINVESPEKSVSSLKCNTEIKLLRNRYNDVMS